MVKTWPELKAKDIRTVSKDECIRWAASLTKPTKKMPKGYSPSVYNNTVGTLQQVFDLAFELGAAYGNPAKAIQKRKPAVKRLTLATQEQFEKLVDEIADAGGGCSKQCADLVRFLAYGGFRKTEAANITWADCDFAKGTIRVYGDPEERTKNGEFRTVPMIDEMRVMLEELRKDRKGEPATQGVMEVHEC
jgi:integrase